MSDTKKKPIFSLQINPSLFIPSCNVYYLLLLFFIIFYLLCIAWKSYIKKHFTTKIQNVTIGLYASQQQILNISRHFQPLQALYSQFKLSQAKYIHFWPFVAISSYFHSFTAHRCPSM